MRKAALGSYFRQGTQYVVQESSSPKIQVTLGASTADPDFTALVDGHRLRDAANAKLALRDISLKRPLTKNLVGSEGKLLTTVVTEKSGSDSIQVLWQTSSGHSSYDLGSCTVTVSDVDSLQADWDRISYFVKARMDELTKDVKEGKGHRMLPGILYALFSNTVEYDPTFKSIKEAFISSNFQDAAAEVVLQKDPPSTQFVASPYWGESLVQLAGFLVNANPDRPAANTTFMMDSFDSFEQTVDPESGHAYFAYARISQREKDTTSCDVYVFNSEKLVVQCSGLHFHEVSNDILDRLLGKPTSRSGHVPQVQEKVAKVSISGPLVSSTPESTEEQVSALETEEIVMVQSPAEDNSPTPSARMTLMQGRRSSGKPPFYLIADGTGSIATYVHLPPFKSKMPVYGIDSPYLRCPSRLTAEVGIPGAAKFIVKALIQAQPEGPFSIGGFSGGAMLSYEVCRQLAAAGRTVDRLLLIDMCCPRTVGAEDKAEVGWNIYESIASQGGLWNASDMTQQHLRAIFASVAGYHPPPMTAEERPRRTAIIWGEKGLIDRCSRDVKLMQLLADRGIPTEPFAGFMEDAKMGAIAWSLPHKTEADLGPNGWDRYVGEMLCLFIGADHLEMPMPGHVHLLHGAMEEAFTYLSGPEN